MGQQRTAASKKAKKDQKKTNSTPTAYGESRTRNDPEQEDDGAL